MQQVSRKEYMKEYNRQYRLRNKEKLTEYYKQWVLSNKGSVAEYKKQWVTENKEKLREYWRNYRNIQYATDPLFTIKKRIRNLISMSLCARGYSKRSKTFQIIGCEFEQFVKHIESQFTDGMCWANRSKWHLDHIVPLATAQSEDEVIELNHFTNIQPLWAIDNLKKGSKV
jgi:hypothetical protein